MSYSLTTLVQFQRAKLYHTKLVKIKRDMAELYQRSNKLKVGKWLIYLS